jgi:uncharacterized alkaline shock family protein YloU
MTDVASGAPSAPAAATETPADDSPSALERAQDVAERAQEVAQRVGGQVSDAVEKASAATGKFVASTVDRLRNNAELTTERGRTTIANEVVEKIAGIAAREVAGVHDLGGDVARVFAAVRERVGLGEADEVNKGVSVRLEGTTAAIDLTIVIVYGYVVFTVTEKVRAQVISSVENLLGLEVTEVNITVDDVYVDETAPAPSA